VALGRRGRGGGTMLTLFPRLLLAAQDAPGPVRLVTADPAATQGHLPAWLLPGLFASVALIGSATWLVAAQRAKVERDPAEHAFKVLSRRLRLHAPHTGLIRRLASDGGHCPPVALLLSESALVQAAQRMQGAMTGRDARLLGELGRRLTLTLPAGPGEAPRRQRVPSSRSLMSRVRAWGGVWWPLNRAAGGLARPRSAPRPATGGRYPRARVGRG